MEPGWVYVLVNSSMPGLAKVGRTTRPPAERVSELSSATGVATPFVLAFDQPVSDCAAAERAVHDELDRRGLRVASNREFFRGSPSEIVRVVLDQTGAGPLSSAATLPARARSAGALLSAGDRCLAGIGRTLQDTGEAIRLYRLAANRGAVAAYARLGRIYVDLHLARPGRASRRRAMAALRQGARRGDPACYAEMASLFAAERHVDNFAKAWALFFAGQPDTADGARLAACCCRYVEGCLALGLAPVRNRLIDAAAPAMLARLVAELGRARGTPSQPRIAGALRWTYLHCPPPDLAPPALPPDAPKLGETLGDARPVCWTDGNAAAA